MLAVHSSSLAPGAANRGQSTVASDPGMRSAPVGPEVAVRRPSGATISSSTPSPATDRNARLSLAGAERRAERFDEPGGRVMPIQAR